MQIWPARPLPRFRQRIAGGMIKRQIVMLTINATASSIAGEMMSPLPPPYGSIPNRGRDPLRIFNSTRALLLPTP